MNDRKIMPKTVSSQAIQKFARLTGAAIVAMGLWAGSVLARDPFRTSNPRPINENTQAAFEAFFKKGDYKSAANYLKQLDPDDPLSLAMRASLTYSDMLGERDQSRKATMLEEFQSFANQTRSAAERLVGNDPLRGNLYLAVSHFFDGVYAFTKEGTLKGTAKVLGELQQIIKYLNEAEAKSPNDPELNLLRGYIDVYSGIYLPFSSPDKGIERLQQFAGPRYLADRGLAMGYLEMKEYNKAMTAVDSAIAAAPDNPELWYLKSRILSKQGKDQESIPYLERAIAKRDQLPVGLVREMERALRKTRERLGQAGR